MKTRLEIIAKAYGIRIHYMDTVSSTNDIARHPEYDHRDIVIAEKQTSGRGQRGNSWSSRAGENLTFSMILTPRFLPAEKQFLLSEAVSLAVIDTLEHYGIPAAIKWTNDIYSGDGKLCGMLIENDIRGMNLYRSIIGIGMNVNQSEFPPELPNPASMRSVTMGNYDRSEVLDKLITDLLYRYSMLEQGMTEKLCSDYDKYIYRKGVQAFYRLPEGEVFTATIVGVKYSGELILRHNDGRLKEYLFREVEFVI